jgi:signal transduction histidine kinase
MHKLAIQALESCPSPQTAAQDNVVAKVFNSIFEDLKTVGSVPTMLHGLRDLIAQLNHQRGGIPPEVNKVIVNFFTLRTGMRFLIQHHIESRQRRKFGFAGILQLKCSPAQIAKAAARDGSAICHSALGQAPEVIIRGDLQETLTYVPSVLNYMLTEILKNACRAVIEKHANLGYDDVLPPVVCVIQGRPDSVTGKIRDEGCGMSSEQMERMWDFLYTTYKHSAWQAGELTDSKFQPGALAGYGVGLPLSRMYARYFGGDVLASSKEGLGTEICISLSRSPFCQEVLPANFLRDLPFLNDSPSFQGTCSSLNQNISVA